MSSGTEPTKPYRQTMNVVFAEAHGIGLLMDVFTPATSEGPGRGRGIICVASGGWTSDRTMVQNYESGGVFAALCERGYTVFAVRPGSLTAFTVEQMLDHLSASIRYIKAHASEFSVDPARLGLIGVSAGGHLTCLSAARPLAADPEAPDMEARWDTGVQAAVAFCPPTDFLDWNGTKYGLDLMEWRLIPRNGVFGMSTQEIDEAVAAISPARLPWSGAPPLLLVHGDADELVPLQQSTSLAESLQNAGADVHLEIVPGAIHSWDLVIGGLDAMASWFDRWLAAASPE